MKCNTSLTFDHSCKNRPKGYSVKVWQYCVSEAIINKTWALRTLKDQAWVNEASDMSICMLGKYLHLSVIDLAKGNYDYLKMRAFGQSYIGALDPSARDRWVKITGRNVPQARYWLYDHQDLAGTSKTLKFNVKQGFGWIKKTKADLKRAGASRIPKP